MLRLASASLAILVAAPSIPAQSPGTLDTSFGGIGFVTTPMNPGGSINDVLVQADQKIVAIGIDRMNGGNWQWAIVRYLPDGSLDSTFGAGGKVLLFGTSATDQATDGQIDSLGRIVVTGRAANGNSHDFTVVRLNPANGSLDTSFGGDGIVQRSMASGLVHDYSHALGIDPTSGKIVVAGTTKGKKSLALAVARFLPDGSPDPSFDGDGARVDDLGALDDNVPYGGVVVQADGKVVVAAAHGISWANQSGSHEWIVARYNTNGSNDASFGASGKVYGTFPGELYQRVASVVLQPDGKIVACGRAKPSGPGMWNTIVARYLVNGLLDTSFDADGWAATQTVSDNQSSRCALQLDGKIVAVGNDNAGPTGVDFVITRFHADGSVDLGFAGDGQAHSLQPGTDAARAIAVDASGRIVAAGYADVGGQAVFAVARFWN